MADVLGYQPVSRPPPNPTAMRKTSRDRVQDNLNLLSTKKDAFSKHKANARAQQKKQDREPRKSRSSLTVENVSVERSLSWSNLHLPSLAENQRSLSASNLSALNDPDLSIKAAVSRKPYDKPHTSSSKQKAVFTAWTQKYFHQLTVGCGNNKCKNAFCKSSPRRKKLDPGMAALVSIELAGYKNHHLCVKDKKLQAARVLDSELFKVEKKENEDVNATSKEEPPNPVPFLYSFYSMSPFRSLFLPCPLTPSGLGIHKTHSHSDLTSSPSKDGKREDNSITSTVRSHLDSFTSTISSSFTNIFKAVSYAETSRESVESLDRRSLQNMTGNETKNSNNKKSPDRTENREPGKKRERIPSVRIFGDEHAVDLEDGVQQDLKDFEDRVAEEFVYKNKEVQQFDVHASHSDSNDGSILFDDYLEDDDDELSPEGFSLTHLTLDMFNKVLDNYVECEDETFLCNTLRTVFSSWEALNLSFQDEGLKKTTKYPFDIKVADVIEVYSMLAGMEDSEKLKGVLTDSIQIMLLKKSCIRQPSELKPFVIILAMPYLFDYVQVAHELAANISALPTKCSKVLAEFIADCFSKAQLESLILGFKSQIKSEPSWNIPTLRYNERVVCFCKTLRLLYTTNNCAVNQQAILSNSTFYCEELTTKIDIKQAYSFWKRMLNAELSTSNSILSYPFLLEPAVKVQVIHIDAITQMREVYQDAIVHQARVQQVQKSWNDFSDASKMSNAVRSAMCPYLLLEIRRGNLIEDTLKQLHEKSSDLKKPLKIKYTSGGEQGLDMGGLQKEFFQVIVETVFDSNYGLFHHSEDGHAVWFNPFSIEPNVMFELVGILLGLGIYNGIILDVHFPLLVYKKLLGYRVTLDDLFEIEPTLASSLSQLLQYDGDVETDYYQTFFVSHSVYGRTMEVELVPDGDNIMVTNDNRQQFVDLYVNSILNESVATQFEEFKRGFYQVCNDATIKLFTPPELELLICGNPDLDFKALECVTEYRDGYSRNHSLMMQFWEIVHRFTFQQKQTLLMFVTGSYRVPLKGLGSMSFYIQRNGPDSNNLPTSMTCFNRLLLPEYVSADKLEKMLLLAIENSKGFGLT